MHVLEGQGACCPDELCCHFQMCKSPVPGCFVPVVMFLFALPAVFTWLAWELLFKKRWGVSRGSGFERDTLKDKLCSFLLFMSAGEAAGTRRSWGWAILVIFYVSFAPLTCLSMTAKDSLGVRVVCPVPVIHCGHGAPLSNACCWGQIPMLAFWAAHSVH